MTDDDRLDVHLGAAAPAEAVGAAVRSAATHAGLGSDRATRLRAVVEELVREARTRTAVDGEETLTVRTATRASRFVVEVLDRREPLRPGASRSLPSRRLVALGFVDHLHIHAAGADGNLAACEVDLAGGPDHDVVAGEQVLAGDAARVDDEAAAALEIRPMEPGDAPGVARCVYRCYGYSYLDPSMYRPELVRRAVRSGLVHPVVAVTPGGEVVGHCALSFERLDDSVPEGGKLVVDPRYRGHHLAERLATVRARVASRLGVPGVWTECVTNHPYSQREVLAGGGVETGLLIGATPTGITMAGLENHRDGRHALLAMWTPVAGSPAATLHVPDRHAARMGRLAGRLGLEREIVTTRRDPAASETVLTVRVSHDSGVGHLRVTRPGSDLRGRVAAELDDLLVDDLAVVQLDVTLTDPAAAQAIDALESLGFSWAAWIPAFDAGHDVLRLQRVGDRPVDVAGIDCARPEGEELVAEVVAEWHRVRLGA